MFQTIKTQISEQYQLLNVTQAYKKPAFEAYDMRHSFITLDQAFDYVGDNSRYQQRITLLLSLQFLFYSFFVMGMPYLLIMPKFCTDTYCSDTPICDSSLVEVIGFDNIIKEFKLYCGNKGKVSFIAASFFIGQMVGGFTFPIFSNIWGRRKLLLFGSTLGALAIMAGSFAMSVSQIYPAYFVAGFGLSGYEMVVYVYITEISAIRFRSIASSILVVIWSSSMLIYPWIVQQMDNWRHLTQLSISIPILLTVVISYFYFVESPRWLASQQRYSECRKVFKFMSIFNRRRPFEFNFMEEIERFNNQCAQMRSSLNPDKYHNHKEAIKASYSYWSILSQSKLLRITLILIWMWFLRYFTYYGLQFSVSKFGLSVTDAIRILAAVELLTGMSSLYFKLKYERKVLFQLCLITMTMAAMLSIVNIPQYCYNPNIICLQQIFHLLSAVLIKAAITIYNSMLNTYTGEVYVTTLRSYGYGFCMTLGQLGSTFAPVYVQMIQEYSSDASPVTIVAGLAFLGALFTCFLPETFNREMYDNIEEQLMASEMATELVSLQHNRQSQ